MGQLLVKNKDIVIPGDVLAIGMDFLPGVGAYRDNDKLIAKIIGMVNVDGRAVKLILLVGQYNPKKGDVIIGKIVDVSLNGWRIDTHSAYPALLSMKEATSEFINRGDDLTQYFDFGDYILTKIIQVTKQKLVDVSMKGPGLKKLKGGRIVMISPPKVPRVIGKAGSMVSLIKQYTNCHLVVGQNGIVYISGDPLNTYIAAKTIKMIEENSHISGLTDMVKEFLEKEIKKIKS